MFHPGNPESTDLLISVQEEVPLVPLVTGGFVGFTAEMREEPVVGKPRHWYRVFSFLQRKEATLVLWKNSILTTDLTSVSENPSLCPSLHLVFFLATIVGLPLF